MVDHLSAVTAGMIVQTDMATPGPPLRFTQFWPDTTRPVGNVAAR
jgi:hypothetical protein